ncbi:4-oxalocrotonate tautomerase [Paenibacillus alginolyticus]|uniref:Tautomerase n=1 Tax=Paenibacillus alginolyticus TaxID=59839 RepID=A0ABT4GH05_9BACL|nr:4-oxalocrotonate tautomerase [Paenibacillus alginolyticus]MCY9666787.1 4-oxalocrotonate tautomerase [Paenibacillus alginolyticus]MCY9695473.1 4-oxalocrotonate tautomerase [Paenibacillus alginolyticus]MEC0146334.1 4-oxalocrotonate tautomerase [Paenibacillus alginolyticus]
MPIVNIQVLQGRPENKIKDLIGSVTDTVANTLEVPKERVRVIVTEVPKSHWGIGGVAVSDTPGR